MRDVDLTLPDDGAELIAVGHDTRRRPDATA
jgi:hypothetical protein